MTLAYSGSFNGYSFGNGARPGAAVQKLSGFGGTQAEIPTSPRYDDGDVTGQPRRPGKKVAMELGLIANTAAELDALRDTTEQAFTPQVAPLPLVINGRQMYVQVIQCDPFRDPSWPGDERTTPCPIEFLAADPVVYGSTLHTYDSDALGAPPANGFAVSCANAGTKVTLNGRALRVSITAATTCASPKIANTAHGEHVVWPGLQIATGQTFVWETDRTSSVGTQRVDGRRTPFTSPPALYPGSNTINVDCATGTFDVVIEWRDTY